VETGGRYRLRLGCSTLVTAKGVGYDRS
jgi:hypothetical protein